MEHNYVEYVTESVIFCLEFNFQVSFYSTPSDQHVRKRERYKRKIGANEVRLRIVRGLKNSWTYTRHVGSRGLWRARGDETVTARTN
jgi:hypothetical protein